MCTLYEHAVCISPIITSFDYAPCHCVDSCESEVFETTNIHYGRYQPVYEPLTVRAVYLIYVMCIIYRRKISEFIRVCKINMFIKSANITKGSFMMYLIEDGESIALAQYSPKG